MSQLQIVIAGYITIMNMLLLHNNKYQLWKVRSANSLSPQIDVLLCVHVMKRLSSEEWLIIIGRDPSQMHVVSFLNLLLMDIYCLTLDGNQLVQLRGSSTIC
jgi:hypothetical protein